MLSARSFLVRGLLAGLIAGIVAFGVAFVLGESSVDAAIALEQAGAPAEPGHGHGDGEPAHSHDTEGGAGTEVPRSLQSTAGLLTATAVAGTVIGGLVGVLSALALGRFGGLGTRGSTLAVTAIGFVSLYVLPSLLYPPNPPAVGSSDTIGMRTALYFVAVAISIVAAVVAVLTGRRLAQRWGGWHATVAAAAGYLLVVVVAFALLPHFDEVPATFPASLLYEFRVAGFLTQFVFWAVLGVLLAEFVARLTRTVEPEPEAVAVGG